MKSDSMMGRSSRYCRRLTRLSRSNFYFSFIFLPKKKRDAILAVYAFCRVVDDSVDGCANAQEKAKGLDRWRRCLDDAYCGRATHPVMIQLIQAIREFHLPREYFVQLIEGAAMDLTVDRYATSTDLQSYCYRVACVVGLVCIRIFGYRNPSTPEFAENLGMAFQWTNILRDVGKDAQMGRIYLPLEDLRRFGVTEEDVLGRKMTKEFRALMEFECARAESFYRRAGELWDERELPALFPALIMQTIYHRILDKILARDFDVFRQEVSLPALVKFWIALTIYCRSRLAGNSSKPAEAAT